MKRRANNTGSVYKDKDGNYIAQVLIGVYSNGKNKYKRFKNKKQSVVVQAMKEYIKEAEINGTAHNLDPKHRSTMLVQDYGRYYIDTYKTTVLKPSSLDTDYRTLRNCIVPTIGHYRLCDVTSAVIQTLFLRALIVKGYSYSTVHKSFTLCKEIFNKATDEGILHSNPCKSLIAPKRSIFNEDDSVVFLDDEEIARFKAEAIKPQYLNGIAIMSILYTGMRAGELCALRYKDIDYNHNKIFVHGNIVTFSEQTETGLVRKSLLQTTNKRDTGRVVFISDTAVQLFRDLQVQNQAADEDFVVRSIYMQTTTVDHKGKELSANNSSNLSNAVNVIFKNAGIDKSGCHCLRHTYASLLIRKGVDIKIVSKQLGHKSVTFTYDRYVHLIDQQQADAVQVLNSI